MQEVGGSIPPGSTIWIRIAPSPSSRGLGHRPFTAVTGVRIPLGTPIKSDAWGIGRLPITPSYGISTEWTLLNILRQRPPALARHAGSPQPDPPVARASVKTPLPS